MTVLLTICLKTNETHQLLICICLSQLINQEIETWMALNGARNTAALWTTISRNCYCTSVLAYIYTNSFTTDCQILYSVKKCGFPQLKKIFFFFFSFTEISKAPLKWCSLSWFPSRINIYRCIRNVIWMLVQKIRELPITIEKAKYKIPWNKRAHTSFLLIFLFLFSI